MLKVSKVYKSILVPHGGTEAGDEALRHAIHLAKLESSEVTILHVIQPWPDENFDDLHDDKKSVQDQINLILSNLEDNVRKFLAERVERCRKEGVQCNGIFRVGKPSDSIIKYANEEKIDLIIMAKKRKIKNYKSLFKIGSVTKQVQEKVNCPILLIEVEN